MSRGKSVVGNQGLISLNGDVLCSVDTETTGLRAGYHDVIEVAFVPLDATLHPMKDVMPFCCMIRPVNPARIDPKAMAVNRITETELTTHGLDLWRSVDLFCSWFDSLALVPGKRLCILAKNWAFDYGFIQHWLGELTFQERISHRARDSQAVAHFINDLYEFKGHKHPFPHVSLSQLKYHLQIEAGTAHRALNDAYANAEVYRKLLAFPYPA